MKVVKQEAVRQLQYTTALLEVLYSGGKIDGDHLESAKQHLSLSYRQIGQSLSKAQLQAALSLKASPQLSALAELLTPNRHKQLLRLCLLDHFAKYQDLLGQIALSLVTKAKLTINRPLFTERAGGVVLAGTPLIELGTTLDQLGDTLSSLSAELGAYPVAESLYFEPFAGFHSKLSRSLGFAEVRHERDSLVVEQRCWRRFASELTSAMDVALEFCQLSAPLCPDEAVSEARRGIKGLKALLGQKVAAFATDGGAIEPELAFDQRVALSQLLSHGLDQLAMVAAAVKSFYRAGEVEDLLQPPAEFLWQPFAQFLLQRGIEPTEALACAEKLQSYCLKTATEPRDLAVEELRFVTAAIRPAYQEFFKISTNGFLDAKNQDSRQKEAIMTKSQTLKKSLGRSGAEATLASVASVTLGSSLVLTASLSLMGLLGLMSVSGCGVKTAPRADIDNLRPTLPFKPKASAVKSAADAANKPKATTKKKAQPKK